MNYSRAWMREKATTKNYRADIDGLRAIAVLLVVAFHAFPGIARGGFIGVDVFFVISGYLISGNILSGIRAGTFTLGDFYVRRARRILPALAVVIAASLGIGWAILLPSAYQSLGLHALAGALFFPNITFWNEVGYFDPAAETKPLLHLWSLGVEEQFYLAWPILLMVLGRWPRTLVAVLCAIVSASFIYSCYATAFSPAAAFYSPLSRLWELGIGGILSLLAGRPRNSTLLSSAGIVLIASGALLIGRTSAFPGLMAVVPVAGASLVILSGSPILAHKLPELLGKISYPLYLWHWPLLSFAAINGMNSIGQRILVVIVSLALAALTYLFIEKPVRFGRFRQAGVAASISAMIGLAVFSAFAVYDGGIPARFPREIRSALALMKYDPETDARYPSCWLAVATPFESYGAECRNGSTLIWGDSHAARLYTGFKSTADDVAQFTRSSCMPSLTVGQQAVCDASNAAIVEEIVRLKPKRVIIFAAWLNYNIDWQLRDERIDAIQRAVNRLKRAGNDVVILGPSPSWAPDLPTAVFRFWTADGKLPDRLPPTRRGYHEVDAVLAAISREEGARFVSVFDQLCKAEGCLTHTPSSASDLLSWDYGHLTTSGAHSVLEALQLK